MSENNDVLLDAQAVADLLSVPLSWVRASTRSNTIPHLYIGRYPRYRRSSVLDWVESLERPGRPGVRLRSVSPKAAA